MVYTVFDKRFLMLQNGAVIKQSFFLKKLTKFEIKQKNDVYGACNV